MKKKASVAPQKVAEISQPKMKVVAPKPAQPKVKLSSKAIASPTIDDPEDMEIARLEKLLGISKKGGIPIIVFSSPNLTQLSLQIRKRQPRN